MVNVLDQYVSDRVSLYHGDSVEMLHGLPDNCLHYSWHDVNKNLKMP